MYVASWSRPRFNPIVGRVANANNPILLSLHPLLACFASASGAVQASKTLTDFLTIR